MRFKVIGLFLLLGALLTSCAAPSRSFTELSPIQVSDSLIKEIGQTWVGAVQTNTTNLTDCLYGFRDNDTIFITRLSHVNLFCNSLDTTIVGAITFVPFPIPQILGDSMAPVMNTSTAYFLILNTNLYFMGSVYNITKDGKPLLWIAWRMYRPIRTIVPEFKLTHYNPIH